jgi:tetratricopeptide (TPR) repeat protein
MPPFRRRPLRRPIRRAILRRAARPPRPAARQALRRIREANALLARGEYAKAALIFEELANKAADRGIERTPNLALQSARAWLEAGETERAMQMIRMALEFMHRTGQLRKLHHMSGRILSELRSHGLTKEAAAIEAEIKEMLAGVDISQFQPVQVGKPANLPAQCPQCGGNVRRDEVEWIDATSAACDYCGSVIVQES